ncbi:MAG: hypothetical protein HY644_05160 [Acidobacteria bacterium]|nr:hypothetical protein [Acidobacteriota bacterium]
MSISFFSQRFYNRRYRGVVQWGLNQGQKFSGNQSDVTVCSLKPSEKGWGHRLRKSTNDSCKSRLIGETCPVPDERNIGSDILNANLAE